MSRPARRSRRARAVWCLTLVVACLVAPVAAWAVAGIDAGKGATVAIRDRTEGIYGSGVVIAPEYVLTAAHVVEAAQDYGLDTTVMDANDAEFDGDVEAISGSVDLALLHVPGLLAAPIAWGTAGAVASGDEVYVLGYPLGMEAMSVTKGIVSAPSQEVEGDVYVQTDASINPGNSGGPLVDAAGRLIGINVMKMASSSVDNIGFAVPLEAVEEFLADEGIAIGTLPVAAAAAPAAGGGAVPQSGGVLLVGAIAVAAALIGAVAYSSRASGAGRPAVAALAAPQVAVAGAAAAPAAGHSVRLALRTDGIEPREVSAALPAVIGRDASADVQVRDGEVSRHHVRLYRSGSDVVVQDLSSTNGVSFNGRGESMFVLRVGESFRIGRTVVHRTG